MLRVSSSLGYFGQLYTAETPSGQLPLAGLQMATADPAIGKTPLSLADVKGAVRKLEDGETAWICNTSAEMLKGGSRATIHGLLTELSAAFRSGKILSVWMGKGVC